jgi:hypothetical protein
MPATFLRSAGVDLPVLAAPMAGGPGTPALVTAAAGAGSMGFVAGGYKTAQALADEIAAVEAAAVPFGVNLFAPNPVPVDVEAFRRYAALIEPEAERYGETVEGTTPTEDDDRWHEKLDVLRAHPVPVVSFTFGIPGHDDLAALRATGAALVQTVTTPDEARQAAEAGVDALAVQAAADRRHSDHRTRGFGPRGRRPAGDRRRWSGHTGGRRGGRRGRCGCRGRRDRAAAQRRGGHVGDAQGGARRPREDRDGADPRVHRQAGPWDPQRVHRRLRRRRPVRLPGVALPHHRHAQGGRGGG